MEQVIGGIEGYVYFFSITYLKIILNEKINESSTQFTSDIMDMHAFLHLQLYVVLKLSKIFKSGLLNSVATIIYLIFKLLQTLFQNKFKPLNSFNARSFVEKIESIYRRGIRICCFKVKVNRKYNFRGSYNYNLSRVFSLVVLPIPLCIVNRVGYEIILILSLL